MEDGGNKKLASYASHGKNLEWRNVCMNVHGKNEGVEKRILDHMWGSAKAGDLTAVMGASGSGKTSLFNVLAGRVRTKGPLSVSADLRLGGSKIAPQENIAVRNQFAFVAQEDSLHIASTPRQALTFSARLRLPKSTTTEEIDAIVERFIDDLGLRGCADTVIGGALLKGVSGGEKRRVSIGVELVANPTLVFLDEPTSGLDAFAARQVVTLLQSVARAGNTVVVTIHQPSSNIFALFDHLVLLHKGRVMHQGRVEDIGRDFESMGHPLPANYNPADWIIDVAQMNELKSLEMAGFFKKDTRTLVEAPDYVVKRTTDHASLSVELAMLLEREKIGILRNPAAVIINLMITAFLGLVFGVIFYGVGQADRSDPTVVQSQLGAIINIMISTMMGQSQVALSTFPTERPMFVREYSTRHYSVVTYFISRLTTEAAQTLLATLLQALVVFYMIGFQQSFWAFLATSFSLAMTSTAVSVLLGSFFSDGEAARSMFTLVVVPQMYFSGVFIAITLIPAWVRWAQYLCSLTYTARLALAYEFADCASGAAEINCNQILDRNEVNPDEKWWYWLALVSLFVGFRVCALVVLKQRADDFS